MGSEKCSLAEGFFRCQQSPSLYYIKDVIGGIIETEGMHVRSLNIIIIIYNHKPSRERKNCLFLKLQLYYTANELVINVGCDYMKTGSFRKLDCFSRFGDII